MGSPQSLTPADRRIVAAWAADCAERVLPLFESAAPTDTRPREAIARTRAFARGDLDIAEEIRRRFEGGGAARTVGAAAAAAARAAGQAAAVSHMGAHALGAAAYAVKAVGLAAGADADAARNEELRWQLDHLSAPARAALRSLPALGTDRSGPLGPGLLASGVVGQAIAALQASMEGGAPSTAVAPSDARR